MGVHKKPKAKREGARSDAIGTTSGTEITFSKRCIVRLCQPTPRSCSVVLAAFVTLLVCGVLFATGHAQRVLEALGGSGLGGHVVLVLLLVQSGLPCGAGYTAFLVAAGYAFGWLGIACFEVGATFGACVGFLTSKWCFRRQGNKCLQSLSHAHQKQLRDLWSPGRLGSQEVQAVCVIALLHNSAVLTFGMVNAIAAVSDCEFCTFMFGSLVSVQLHGVMHVGIGHFIRVLWDERDIGEEVFLHMVSLVASVALFAGCTWYSAKHLPVQAMSSLVACCSWSSPSADGASTPQASPKWRVEPASGVRVRREKDEASPVIDIKPQDSIVEGCPECASDGSAWLALSDGHGFIYIGSDAVLLKQVNEVESCLPCATLDAGVTPVAKTEPQPPVEAPSLELPLKFAPVEEVEMVPDRNASTLTFGISEPPPEPPNCEWVGQVPFENESLLVALASGSFLDTGSGEARHFPRVTCLGRARDPRCGASAFNENQRRRMMLQADEPETATAEAAEILAQLDAAEAARSEEVGVCDSGDGLWCMGPFCKPRREQRQDRPLLRLAAQEAVEEDSAPQPTMTGA